MTNPKPELDKVASSQSPSEFGGFRSDNPDVTAGESIWPAHVREVVPWKQAQRQGTKDDRMLTSVEVWLPPMIADRDIELRSDLVTAMSDAVREITVLDTTHAGDLQALSSMLLRTESVASSKIEHVEASMIDYAKALHGSKANSSAVSMVAATTALETMISNVSLDPKGQAQDITMETLTVAHEALMRDDTMESAYAGRVRDMQNWIGGSDYSPRGALYVPPPPTTVERYMADLVAFSNRDDIPVLAQAAIAHAQFESIHPFTDGNGRIGRALVNTILRRRGATTKVVVPIASALVAQRQRYFDLLGKYRDGAPAPIIAAFAGASRIAARESQTTAKNLAEIPQQWATQVGRVRAGSATHELLGRITASPVITADDAVRTMDAGESAVYRAIDRLADAGVLVPLTDRKRDQVWGAVAILDEIEDLSTRIEVASR